jgi:hypothetical protein
MEYRLRPDQHRTGSRTLFRCRADINRKRFSDPT